MKHRTMRSAFPNHPVFSGKKLREQTGPSLSENLQGRGVVSVAVRLYDNLHILVERH
jgi:hypothetical protein